MLQDKEIKVKIKENITYMVQNNTQIHFYKDEIYDCHTSYIHYIHGEDGSGIEQVMYVIQYHKCIPVAISAEDAEVV